MSERLFCKEALWGKTSELLNKTVRLTFTPVPDQNGVVNISGAPNDNFRKNICSGDDLRPRIFETFVVKFLACVPLLGFSNIYETV